MKICKNCGHFKDNHYKENGCMAIIRPFRQIDKCGCDEFECKCD